MNRRHLHARALALALAAMGAAARSPAQPASSAGTPPRFAGDPFALGVASGQPRPDSVLLWTRLVDPLLDAPDAPDLPVHCEWFADEALRRPLGQTEVCARRASAHSVHVQASGLAPGRELFYRFRCGDALSPVGRSRTAPAPGASPATLTLALASCQHYEHGLFTVYRDIAASALDAVVFVGDYIYEGTIARPVRRHGAPPPVTLDEYRARHALYKSDPDLRLAHARHPWILTWDDHEVVNDYAGDTDPLGGDSAAFVRRRAAAYQAYFEHMPVWPGPQGAAMRIHDRFAFGSLATLWTLDCRQHRSPQACPDPLRGGGRLIVNCTEAADPARTLLGQAQERWLAEGLAASRSRWNLLALNSQVSGGGIDTPLGRSLHSDGWEAYPAARTRLLRAIAQRPQADTVLLGGDVHRHVAALLRERPNDPASPAVACELVTSSISTRGASAGVVAAIQRSNPDIAHLRADERGYVRVQVSAAQVLAEFRGTAHPVRADSVMGTQARWAIPHGRAELLPA